MKELNWPTRLWIVGTTALAVLLIAWQWYRQPPRLDNGETWAAAILGTVLVFLSSVRPIKLRRSAHLSLGTVFGFAAICLFGPVFGTVCFVVGLTLSYLLNQWRGRFWRWYQILFSVAAQALALDLGGQLYLLLYREDVNPVLSLGNALAFLLGGGVFVLLNGVLISAVIGLSEHARPREIFQLNWTGSWMQLVSHVPLSGILIVLYQSRPWAVFLILLPLAAIHLSLEEAALLRMHTQQTLQFVATLVDAREPFTARHSRQVAEYTVAIAQETHLPLPLQDTLRVAATLHDLGKLSIAESVLLKPQTLEPGEWDKIRAHPSTGASLVEQLPFLREASEIILRHHEHFDGSGYPDGKRGEEIPLGARLLAVADALDAITAARPYRPGATLAQAFVEIQKHAGTQFDPQIVEAALRARSRLEQIYLASQHNDSAGQG